MLLTRIRRSLRGHDEGAALASVMSLMLLGALLAVLILSSVVASIASTTTVRATVQSEAAAQAGVDVALASVVSGNCVPTYTSTVAPKYSVAVSYTTAATLSSGTSWTAGCPTASATFMKLVSTGTAASVAVGKTTTGNTEAVEAIYSRPVATSPLTPSGPAIYAYSAQAFGGSGTLVSLDGSNDADVMIKTGDVSCSGGSAAKGDFVVDNGNLTLSGSCGVTGNAWATGSGKGVVNLSGGVQVGGNVVANGLTISSGTVGGSVWTTGATTINSATIGGSVTVTANNFSSGGSNKIGGNLWASGSANVTNGDDVKGNATAQTLALTGGNIGTSISNQAWSRGAVTGVTWYTIKAHLTAKSVPNGMKAGGGAANGITVVPAGPGAGPAATATPTVPTVPNWINFTYKTSDWPGYAVATLGTTCTPKTLQDAVDTFGGGKGVIDARACTVPIVMGGNDKVALSNDTAIISTKGFDLSYSRGSSGFTSTVPVDLFLITPDTTVESPTAATCPSGSSVGVGGGFVFSSTVSTIIYSPCLVTIASGINYYGQVFAGRTTIAGSAKLFYTPVGLPGYDLNTGATSSPSASTSTWTVSSVRNVVG